MNVWPPYRTVRELVHVHAGRAAVIVGGGPSALEGFKRAPSDALCISVNAHGFKLRSCEYAVALDKIDKQLRPFGVPIVSRHLWADFRILETPAPNSGIAAAWVARLMGCGPIFLTGMDCYAGDTYFHNATAATPGKSEAAEVHLARWREFFRTFRGDYVALGGPLERMLAEPHAPAPLQGPIARELLLSEVAGRFVEIRRAVELGFVRRPFFKGDTVELRLVEADRLELEHMARRITPQSDAA